jgi:hypothetical protein
MVTGSKLHDEDPQILGATVQNSAATGTRRPASVHPCNNWTNFSLFQTQGPNVRT